MYICCKGIMLGFISFSRVNNLDVQTVTDFVCMTFLCSLWFGSIKLVLHDFSTGSELSSQN